LAGLTPFKSLGRSAGSWDRASPTDGQRAARRQELAHLVECDASFHMVQRRDRGNHAKRRGCEGMGEEVTADEPDLAVLVLAAGQVDARCVLVDANDVRDEAGELPGQRALSASDFQYPLASWRTASKISLGEGAGSLAWVLCAAPACE
jgi:hypothetical protein